MSPVTSAAMDTLESAHMISPAAKIKIEGLIGLKRIIALCDYECSYFGDFKRFIGS